MPVYPSENDQNGESNNQGLSDKNQDLLTTACSQLQEGIQQHKEGKLQFAIVSLTESWKKFQLLGDLSKQIKALRYLTLVAYNHGEYQFVIKYGHKCLSLEPELKIQEQILSYMGNAYRHLGNYESAIQFLDKEVRKLWDLSNKRNKVNIQKLSDQAIKIEEILQKLQTDVDSNQTNLLKMRNSIETNMKNIENLGSSEEDLNSIRMNISSIDTQLMLLDDTVQALNNYKNQLNQTILEIQTQISSSEDLFSTEENEN